ncbi:MAG TPA: UrcA family protein [Rhizomicrobium sp.]|jgi:UrcA family protein|nr:UrcA family protein [Rhizomicrobium sp.]
MKRFLITGAAAILCLAGAANAQSIKSDPSETVTVVPPYSTQSGAPLKGGMQTTIVSLNRYVSYRDLDLSKPSDRIELENRVHATAREACNALDAKFPQSVYIPVPESQDCVGSASRGALAMANIPNNGEFTEE